MSQHKTNQSNWSDEQKKEYWERRGRNLRGTSGYAIEVQTIYEKDGKTIKDILPVSGKKPSAFTQRGQGKKAKSVDRRFTQPNKGHFVRYMAEKKIQAYVSKEGAGR